MHGAYRLPTTRRGVLDLGPIRIDDVEGLGLARKRHRIDTRVRLIVHPPIEALPPIRVPAGDDPLLGEELRQSLVSAMKNSTGFGPTCPAMTSANPLAKLGSGRRTPGSAVPPPRHGRLSVVIDTRPPATPPVPSIAPRRSPARSPLPCSQQAMRRIETTDGRSTPLVSGNPQLESLLEFLALLDDGAEQINPAIPSGPARSSPCPPIQSSPLMSPLAAASLCGSERPSSSRSTQTRGEQPQQDQSAPASGFT